MREALIQVTTGQRRRGMRRVETVTSKSELSFGRLSLKKALRRIGSATGRLRARYWRIFPRREERPYPPGQLRLIQFPQPRGPHQDDPRHATSRPPSAGRVSSELGRGAPVRPPNWARRAQQHAPDTSNARVRGQQRFLAPWTQASARSQAASMVAGSCAKAVCSRAGSGTKPTRSRSRRWRSPRARSFSPVDRAGGGRPR